MEKPKKITLKYPITRKDENGQEMLINSVNIYRMKLKHLRSMPKDLLTKLQEQGDKAVITLDEAVPLLVAITSLNEKDIDELDIADFQKINETINKGESFF